MDTPGGGGREQWIERRGKHRDRMHRTVAIDLEQRIRGRVGDQLAAIPHYCHPIGIGVGWNDAVRVVRPFVKFDIRDE